MLSGVARSTWAKAQRWRVQHRRWGRFLLHHPCRDGQETLSQGLCPLRHIRWLGPSLEKDFV